MENVIIFGAGSAIAQAYARLVASDKSNLVLVDKNAAHLEIIAADLKVRGAATTHTISADLTNTDNHLSLWEQVTQLLPNIDTVLIAYGTLGNQGAGEKDFQTAESELSVNFISVISILTVAGNALADAGRGTIAAISSVAGDRGRQSNYIYGSAKGGLSIFLQGLRNRLSKKGVHVLTIKPGFVDTPMTADFKKGLLWVKPENIGQGIYKAIKKNKDIVYLPWFWRYIMLIIKLIPERIFKKLSL